MASGYWPLLIKCKWIYVQSLVLNVGYDNLLNHNWASLIEVPTQVFLKLLVSNVAQASTSSYSEASNKIQTFFFKLFVSYNYVFKVIYCIAGYTYRHWLRSPFVLLIHRTSIKLQILSGTSKKVIVWITLFMCFCIMLTRPVNSEMNWFVKFLLGWASREPNCILTCQTTSDVGFSRGLDPKGFNPCLHKLI